MAGLITDLSPIGSIDRASDLLEIVDLSGNTSYKVTPNNLFGITGGSLLSTTDTQSVTNKTLDNTNTITIKDTLLTLQDDSDTSKQARFQLSGITTSTTRVYILPDASSTLADVATAQTFTNKTVTAPTISGGTIDNTAITVDAINEHTSNNGVTVDGLNIMNGALNTNNSVVTANITDTAVTPAKLQTGTGAAWGWTTYTPTVATGSVGNGTVTGSYIQTGKTVSYQIKYTLGSSSTAPANTTYTLPVTAKTTIPPTTTSGIIGTAAVFDNSASQVYIAFPQLNSSTTVKVIYLSSAVGLLTNTVPVTFATSDIFYILGNYEAV